MRPRSPDGKPVCDFVHVLPPSVERCTPDPGPPATKQQVRRWRCHVVAMRTSGLRGSSLHVVHAGPVVYVKHAAPGRAAVGRLVETTLTALAPERTLRRDVDDVGVARVNQDAADMFAFLEADVLP